MAVDTKPTELRVVPSEPQDPTEAALIAFMREQAKMHADAIAGLQASVSAAAKEGRAGMDGMAKQIRNFGVLHALEVLVLAGGLIGLIGYGVHIKGPGIEVDTSHTEGSP